MRLLNTNIIVDLFGTLDTVEARWSADRYADAVEAGRVACNLVIVAELSSYAPSSGALMRRLADMEIDVAELSLDAAFRAGAAFQRYRERGGTRTTILPDFLIAAHAASMGATLVTRDRRLANYFPELSLITPETHP